MNLEEALLKIEELEDEIRELEKDVETLEEAAEDANKEISDLESEVDHLEKIEGEYDELTEQVAIFRDPSNWNGNAFVPVLTYLRTDEPYNLI